VVSNAKVDQAIADAAAAIAEKSTQLDRLNAQNAALSAQTKTETASRQKTMENLKGLLKSVTDGQ